MELGRLDANPTPSPGSNQASVSASAKWGNSFYPHPQGGGEDQMKCRDTGCSQAWELG